MQRSRRQVLAGLAAVGSLSGCVSGGDGGDEAGGGDGPATGDGAVTTERTDTPVGPTLDTYDVGGSPGEAVPVRPDGSVVLMDFFATWCAPCKPQMGNLGTIRERFPDVHMLSITWESEEEAIRSFWQEYDGTWPVASDPQVDTGQEYGVDRLPTLLIFDGNGEEQWRHVGLAGTDTVAEQLRAAGARETGEAGGGD